MWVWIIVGALVLIILYVLIVLPNLPCDPLQKAIAPGVDGWSVTHVLLFTILGYLYPSNILLFFFLGVLWELAEWVIGIVRSDITHKEETYWINRTSDLIANGVGLLLGYGLAYLSGSVNNSNE